MKYAFTDYVREVTSKGSSTVVPPSDEVWEKLRSAVVGELRKRSLWSAPPSWLGIYGARAWSEEEALEELVAAGFCFIFVERLATLRAHLEIKKNIEGLVFLALKQFFYDLQKKHDPLGFRVYTVARSAVRRMVEEGELDILEGSSKIGSDTVIGSASGAVDLDTAAAAWADALLPELVTARGKATAEVAGQLGRMIRNYAGYGTTPLPFSELVSALKRAVRQRWKAVWDQSQGETAFEDIDQGLAALVPLVRPDTSFEDRDAFGKLLDCVSEGIEKLPEKPKTREYLYRLWSFLEGYVAESPPSGGEPEEGEDSVPEILLSQRKVAKLLRIPRDRLPGLYSILGELLTKCRESASSGSSPGPSTSGEKMDAKQRRQQLGQQVAEALARQEAAAATQSHTESSQLGDLYVLDDNENLPLQWAVLENDLTAGRFLLVAADFNPLVGSADVEVPASSASGALSLRCGCDLWVDGATLETGQRVGVLDEEIVEEAKRKRQALAEGKVTGSALEQETDFEPEYRDWIEALGEARRRHEQTGSVSNVVTFPSRWRSLVQPGLVAASILLLLASGVALLWQQKKIVDLRRELASFAAEPSVNVPLLVLSFQDPVRGDAYPLILTPDSDSFVLVFQPEDPSFQQYSLEILAPGEDPLWSHDKLEITGIAELVVTVPRDFIPTGVYQLRLYGVREDSRQLLEVYKIEIRES